ncbi:MAG: type 1 glutamine amidotransferase, partial [Candidatus Brocadiales bacterium]|nr:type 1 glutamine amidotransferase [Candidatus Bathyanammoxibius amoris]
KHVPFDGAGNLGEFMQQNNIPYRELNIFEGEYVENPGDFSAILTMGGTMDVNEEDRYPFLEWEHKFLEKAMEEGVPLLGICLGAEMLSYVSGGEVTREAVKQVGWYEIWLTEDGRKDPLFEGLPEKFVVFLCHSDKFSIPPGGERLAESRDDPNEVFTFRLDRITYGLQFHPEVTTQIINDWVGTYKGQLTGQRIEEIKNQTRKNLTNFKRHAERIARNFFNTCGLLD